MEARRFDSREDAGRQLAQRLLHLKNEDPVVLALPRGGVPVGLEIARALGAPLDLLFVRKIGVPWQPELAAGAVVDGDHPQVVLNEDVVRYLDLPESYIDEERDRQLQEIERRRQRYRRGRPPARISGRTVIVVDDGIATGATIRAALRGVKDAGAARRILAAPVAPAATVDALRAETDEIVVLSAPDDFGALGFYYRDFHQLDDDEVIALLQQAPQDAAAGDTKGPPETAS
jgi:putative phosphoribosyl transferase